MKILAIDPGKNLVGFVVYETDWHDPAYSKLFPLSRSPWTDAGVARFDDLLALRLWLDAWSAKNGAGYAWSALGAVVSEIPQVYRAANSKGDPNDLIDVALTAGVCLSAASRARAVKPHEWKGAVPKDVHNRRVLKACPPEVLAMLEEVPKGFRHNAIDAVGLMQWALATRCFL